MHIVSVTCDVTNCFWSITFSIDLGLSITKNGFSQATVLDS